MEIFLSVLLGLLTAGIVQLSKKTGLTVSGIFVIIALLCGGAWTGIEYFGPVGLTDNIFEFASKVIGSGAIVYSFISVGKKSLN